MWDACFFRLEHQPTKQPLEPNPTVDCNRISCVSASGFSVTFSGIDSVEWVEQPLNAYRQKSMQKSRVTQNTAGCFVAFPGQRSAMVRQIYRPNRHHTAEARYLRAIDDDDDLMVLLCRRRASSVYHSSHPQEDSEQSLRKHRIVVATAAAAASR